MAENIKVICERSDIVAIADAVRNKTGQSGEMTLGGIVSGINGISVGGGTDTSDATATADEIFAGETAYTADGKVTGTFTIEEELTEQNDLISQIATLVATKATPSGTNTSDATATAGDILSGKTAYVKGSKVTGNIATKTSSNLTASGATVTVPAGYYSTQASKAVATATQATPTVTINTANGLITATATQTAGYVTAGTKSDTKQLAFQAAQTITPGTTDKTIAANTYLGGVQTIKGDANLVASNIVSGKSIFGVVGTATAGGSSGDTSAEDGLVTRTLTSYTNDRVTTIDTYAFYAYSSLTTVSFPKVTTIGSSAFNGCYNLTTVSFPKVTTIGFSAFHVCSSLTTVSFPVATTIGSGAFRYCYSLTTVSFPAATTIGTDAFSHCSSLTTVSFPKVTTIGASAFHYCSSLTTVSFPVATTIGASAFNACYSLTTVSFPKVTTIDVYAFNACSSLTTVSFPKVTTIGTGAFRYCYNLKFLYLTGSSVCTLSASNAFTSTPIGGYTTSAGTYGSIYVPASLLASYKAASNWSYFSSRFVGI